MTFVEFLFWFGICFILYAYWGYPLILLILSKFRSRPVRKGDITPTVSFIITAYNEERTIQKKIENTLKQDYPTEKFEIIVASDCSTDRTDEIVKIFFRRGVRLIRAQKRGGKEAAQKLAVDATSGEILVFSDVAAKLEPDGIRNVTKNFNDPSVGCVSSVDRFVDADGKVSGEGAYVQYEMSLRDLESRVNTLVGLSGSFFATRKELCYPWVTDLPSDFNTLINAIKKGYRGVSDRDSICYYPDLTDEKQEFHRKIRTVVRGIRVCAHHLLLLNINRYGLFSWQLFSHKLCRWLVPFALIATILSNGFLALHFSFYGYLFLLQMIFYTGAIAGWRSRIQTKILRIPYFFVMVNLSILIAWYRYLKGEHFIIWKPSPR